MSQSGVEPDCQAPSAKGQQPESTEPVAIPLPNWCCASGVIRYTAVQKRTYLWLARARSSHKVLTTSHNLVNLQDSCPPREELKNERYLHRFAQPSGSIAG